MEKTFKDFIPLEEGVNDPSIFKAVFLAGGPGSGKSFVVGNTALTAQGLKLINSDDAFERSLAKAGMGPTPENIFSDKGQDIRARAKALTARKMDIAIKGRLGLVIDGTGKDYAKIAKQKASLEALGYDTMLVFVNTDEETAQARNRGRARTLPEPVVSRMWKEVQNNIGKFQNLFGNNMLIVDNSDKANSSAVMLSAYRKISNWTRQPPHSYIATRWIKAQRSVRKEDLNLQKVSKLKPVKSVEQKKYIKSREKQKVFKSYKVGPEANLEQVTPDMEVTVEEMGITIRDKLKAKTVYKRDYEHAAKILRKVYDRKKKEAGRGSMRHNLLYYAAEILRTVRDGEKMNARILAKMLPEEYQAQKHEWGTPEGTEYYKNLTPGEGKTACPKCGCKCGELPCKTCGTFQSKVQEGIDKDFMEYLHRIEVVGFTDQDVLEMERDIDAMSFDDFIDLGMYEEDELEDMDTDDDGDYDILDDVEITEALSIQGRMKRRFNARRNRQKLKVARMRRSRMASSPDRIKMRAARGARNMFKKRLARGRDVSSMPPAEKNRLETMLKRFAPIVSKLAQRMIPQVRKAEIGRLKNRKSASSMKAKKFVVKKGGTASKYKAKKFKIKKAGKK